MRKHISGVCRIADSRVLEHWRVVDAVPFHRDRKISRIGRDGVNAPRNGNQFGLTRHSRAGTAGRENGVSHATVATIEHDVFTTPTSSPCAVFTFVPMILLVCT